MKKLISLALVGVLGFSFIGCSSQSTEDTSNTTTATEETATADTSNEESTEATSEVDVSDKEPLIIGATSVPHEEILNFIKDGVIEKGVNLEIVPFTEYTLINPATTDGSLDGNFFQHEPFLEDYNTSVDAPLINYGPIHIEPLGLYSEEYDFVPLGDEFPTGSTIAIPSDSSNETRALKLIADIGLITLDSSKTENITLLDITENPHEIEFVELDSAMIPRTLSETTFGVINSNFALEAGIIPAEEAIAIEGTENNPYANILVINQENENNEDVKILYDALTSEETRSFIEEKYQGSVIPAF